MMKILLTFSISLSLFSQLKVTRPDGSLATGVRIRVTVSRGWRYGNFYDKTFTVTNGLITDSIDDATYNAETLSFKVVVLLKF